MKRIVATATLFLIPAIAAAQVFSTDDNSARMTLGNDTYVAGNLLNITEDLSGDLLIAGNRVMVNANIDGDVQSAGSSVSIDGSVSDDVRAAGGDVTISGNIGGDVIVFGGSVLIMQSAVIEGNLLVSGGSVVIDGTVRGNVRTSGGDVKVGGAIGGTSDIRGEKVAVAGTFSGNAVVVAREWTVGPDSRFGADVRYWTSAGQMDLRNNVAGTATFDPELAMRDKQAPADAGALGAILAALTIFSLFSAALTIGIFQLATRTFFIDSAKRLQHSPLMSMLWGLVYFILTPGIVILLTMTIIGIPLALALAVLYIITVAFAKILTAMVFARWAELRSGKKWHPVAVYFVSLAFWIVLKLVGLVPFLGWIAVFLAVIAGYGAFLSIKAERYRKVA